MELTNTQRISKLLNSLTDKPKFILPYLVSNLQPIRRTALDQGLPWWSFAAIEEADRVFPGKRIFEYGSGGSTLRYARRGSQITAIEDDMLWHSMLSKRLRDEGIANRVSLNYHPFNFFEPESFLDSAYLRALSTSVYDVIIIDGQDVTFKERLTCFRHAEKFMEAGGIILLDDFWRYESLLASHSAKQVQVFESVGPCRIGVTSTALFYY